MDQSIIIIGNGFDINLGLKTKYNDFMENWPYFKDGLYEKKTNYFARHLAQKFRANSPNWVDVELEIFEYPKSISIMSPGNIKNQFIDDYKNIKIQLCDYIKSIDTKNINEESIAYHWLPTLINYLRYQHYHIDIYNFNYTSTVTQILKKFKYNENVYIKNNNVHGIALNNNIIFGTSDNQKMLPEFNITKKSFATNFGINFDSSKMYKAKKIFIFGHSLGSCDHNYFENIFSLDNFNPETQEGKILHIYTYGEESVHNITGQMNDLTNGNLAHFRLKNRVHIFDLKTNLLDKEELYGKFYNNYVK